MDRPEFNAGPICSTMVLFDRELADSFSHALRGDALVGRFLPLHPLDKIRKRNRRRTDVSRPLQCVHRPPPALVGECVARLHHGVGTVRSQRVQQLPLDRHVGQVHHDGLRKLDGIRALAHLFQPVA